MPDNTSPAVNQQPVTYRDSVQEVIRQIWSVYDTVGGLRDAADLHEKEFYNTTRGKLYDAAMQMSKLDNGMSRARANTKM